MNNIYLNNKKKRRKKSYVISETKIARKLKYIHLVRNN